MPSAAVAFNATTVRWSMRRARVLCSPLFHSLPALMLCARSHPHACSAGMLLRRRYRFSTDAAVLTATAPPDAERMPFFTLKRPLQPGEVRRLNLFEPRWLCLLDHLVEMGGNAADTGAADMVDGAQDNDAHPLVNASFGCIFAANRYYAAGTTLKGAVGSGAVGGDADGTKQCDGSAGGWGEATDERLADVIVHPVARRARIVRVEEGTRPVSGARRLSVWIQGEDVLRVDSETLVATDGGYLVARTMACSEEWAAAVLSSGSLVDQSQQAAAASDSNGQCDPENSGSLRVVSVVGLAHANGVLERCIERKLRDQTALARAATEAPEWVGY